MLRVGSGTGSIKSTHEVLDSGTEYQLSKASYTPQLGTLACRRGALASLLETR